MLHVLNIIVGYMCRVRQGIGKMVARLTKTPYTILQLYAVLVYDFVECGHISHNVLFVDYMRNVLASSGAFWQDILF